MRTKVTERKSQPPKTDEEIELEFQKWLKENNFEEGHWE